MFSRTTFRPFAKISALPNQDTMKYRLTDEKINTIFGVLTRIEAIKDFGEIKKGDKGGFIANEKNLSQDGNAWISGNAWVYGDAQVYGDAWISGNARVYGNAWVYGNAQVYGNARVYGNAIIKFDCELEFLVLGSFGLSQRTITATKTTVYAGCFEGDFAAFVEAVVSKYGDDYGGTKNGYANCIAILKSFMDTK